jgi:hypothetical protein
MPDAPPPRPPWQTRVLAYAGSDTAFRLALMVLIPLLMLLITLHL